jgi:long-subunit fatty acid transport protein
MRIDVPYSEEDINTAIVDDYEQFRGINFNLGLLWDIGKFGNIGAVVKTPFTATIQHRFRFYQTTSLGNPINSDSTTGPITVEEEVELEMPFSYGFGWSKRFKDTFTLGIDIYRTEWGNYTLTNGKGEEFSPIDGRPKSLSNVKATTHVRIGSEYLFLIPKHKLAIPVRAGLFYDPEPSEGNPNDVFGFALGSGLTFQRCSLDLAYQLRWARDVDTGNLIANSKGDITQHTVLASIIFYF